MIVELISRVDDFGLGLLLKTKQVCWGHILYWQWGEEEGEGEGRAAPNTGTNVTKSFTLATKSWKLVARLAGSGPVWSAKSTAL